MPQEITTMDGGEAPLAVRGGAAPGNAKTGETDVMQQHGGQAPSPGYTPSTTDASQKASAPSQGKGDPSIGGVARSR